MKETEDYELYDRNFDEWLRKGREAFGIEDHPGARGDKHEQRVR